MTDETPSSDPADEAVAEGGPGTEDAPESGASEEEAPETVTITTPDGHEVVMTTKLSGRDLLVLMELEGFDRNRPAGVTRVYPQLMNMVERHVVSHTYPDPDVLSLDPLVIIRDILKPWQIARRERAVPKQSGNRSQRRSRKRR